MTAITLQRGPFPSSGIGGAALGLFVLYPAQQFAHKRWQGGLPVMVPKGQIRSGEQVWIDERDLKKQSLTRLPGANHEFGPQRRG